MYDSGLMRVSDLDSEAGADVLYVEEGELKAILLGRELKAGTAQRTCTCISYTIINKESNIASLLKAMIFNDLV